MWILEVGHPPSAPPAPTNILNAPPTNGIATPPGSGSDGANGGDIWRKDGSERSPVLSIAAGVDCWPPLSLDSDDDDDDDDCDCDVEPDNGSNNINVLLSKSAYRSVIAIPAKVPAAIPANPPNILLPTVNPIAIFSTSLVE